MASRPKWALVFVSVIVASAWVLPADSLAGTAYIEGSTLHYDGTDGAEKVTVILEQACQDNACVHYVAQDSGDIGRGPGCDERYGGYAEPPSSNAAYCRVGVDRVAIALAGGNDYFSISDQSPHQTPLPVEVKAGSGDDELFGGQVADQLNGGEGNDWLWGAEGDDYLQGLAGDDLLEGAGGNDLLEGEVGNDRLVGHGGDDRLDGYLGADRFLGGDGRDTALYARRSAGVTVSIDDKADDGNADDEAGGVRDFVRTDVEGVITGPGDDVLTGNVGAPDLLATGDGDDAVFSRDGHRDEVDCGLGEDSLSADADDAAVSCEHREADLDLSAEGPEEVETGDTSEYVVRIRNDGPSTAQEVLAQDTITGSGRIISVTSDRGTCAATATTYTCQLGDVPLGESREIRITVKFGVLPPAGESEAGADSSIARPSASVFGSSPFALTERSWADAAGVTASGAGIDYTPRASTRTRDPNLANNSDAGRTTVKGCLGKVSVNRVIVRGGCIKKVGSGYVLTSRAWVNGLQVDTRGKMTINPRRLLFSTAGTATVKAGPIKLWRGELALTLRGSFRLASSGSTVKGLPISGGVNARFSASSILFDVRLGLPSVFGGVEVAGSFSTQDGRGLKLESLLAKASEVELKRILTLRDLELRYTDATKEWAAAVQVVLPSPAAPKVSAALRLVGGRFKSLRAEVSEINKPLAHAVFLQRVGFGVELSPFALEGSIGVSAGPKIPPPINKTAVSVDGSLRYTPGRFRIGGNLNVAEATLASGSLNYRPPTSITLDGSLNFTKAGFGVTGKAHGDVNGTTSFSLTATNGRVILPAAPDLPLPEGYLSNKGISACVGGAGFVYRWGDKLPRFGCGLEKLASVATSRVRVAQAGASLRIPVPAGETRTMFVLTGSSAAPSIRVTDPSARSFDVAGDQGLNTGKVFAFRSPNEDFATYVLIERPQAGTWTIALLPGSAPLATSSVAGGIPAPSVKGKVGRRGKRYRLTWTLRRVAGQRVSFFERGTGIEHRILQTSARTGTRRFRPSAGPPRRRLVAIVEQDGLIRDIVKLDSFRVHG